MFVYQRVSFKHEITETSSIHGGFANVFFHQKMSFQPKISYIVDIMVDIIPIHFENRWLIKPMVKNIL